MSGIRIKNNCCVMLKGQLKIGLAHMPRIYHEDYDVLPRSCQKPCSVSKEGTLNTVKVGHFKEKNKSLRENGSGVHFLECSDEQGTGIHTLGRVNLERDWENRLGWWQSSSAEIQEQVIEGNREERLRDGQCWTGQGVKDIISTVLTHYLHFIFSNVKKWDI